MKKSLYQMTLSAMLMAIAIIIPMFSPIKILIEPASFTLGSHIAIMIAMFISPFVAISVEIGATIGFLLGGFPLVVVLRALSQLIFVCVGAMYLKKKPNILNNIKTVVIFAFGIGFIHAIAEVFVVLPIYISNGTMSNLFYQIFILVGVGTFIHSCIDFVLAIMIWKLLIKNKRIQDVSVIKSMLLKNN